MNKELIMENSMRNKIFTIRGVQVIADKDLAELYEVSTKALNQAVKRNFNRFPSDFMFQLNKEEFENWRSQFVTSKSDLMGLRRPPFVFTEHGVTMLSAVLRSNTAVRISVEIIKAFIAMRKFIASNAQIFQRLGTVERKQIEYDKKFEHLFRAIEDKSIKPSKGIFFDGQIFDAYKFVSDLVRGAKISIILIDNYIDDSVLTLFSKRNKNVIVKIFTKEISKPLKLDLKKHNSQYPQIEIKEFSKSHDRFMIIDDKEIYHIGASLKDLGKKWFAFSKFDKESFQLTKKLEELI